MATTAAVSTNEEKSKRLKAVIRAIGRSRTPERASDGRLEARKTMFEELNQLLPAVDVNNLIKDDPPTRYSFLLSIHRRGPPLSTLTTLLDCGLDLGDDNVLMDVLDHWIFGWGMLNPSVDTDEVILLLANRGGDPSTLFHFAMDNSPYHHINSILSIISNNLPILGQILNVDEDPVFYNSGTCNALFEVLRQLDDGSKRVFKERVPSFLEMIDWIDTEDLKAPELVKLLLVDYKFEASYSFLTAIIHADFHVPSILDTALDCCDVNLEEAQNTKTLLQVAINANRYSQAVTLIKAGAKVSNVRKVHKVIASDTSGLVKMAKLMTFLGFPAHGYLDLDDPDHLEPIRQKVEKFKTWFAEFESKPRTLFESAAIKMRNQLTKKQIIQLIASGELPSNIVANRILFLEQFDF